MKSSNIGGQAVLEGIMMKNGPKYAVAVRKPDGEIEVKVEEYKSVIKWEKLTKIPFVRGAFNFVDSLVLGMKTLTYSASFLEEETEILLTEEEAIKQQNSDNATAIAALQASIDDIAKAVEEGNKSQEDALAEIIALLESGAIAGGGSGSGGEGEGGEGKKKKFFCHLYSG